MISSTDLDEADEEACVHMQCYYKLLMHGDIGSGFFHWPLENFHLGMNLPMDQDFFSSLRTLEEIESPERMPLDHLLCAIACK